LFGERERRGHTNPIINRPTNPMVTPLLNNLCQFTMANAYWKPRFLPVNTQERETKNVSAKANLFTLA